MQSKKSYGSGKSSTKVFHCAMNDRDVLGNAIGEESTDDNDDNAVLFNSKKRTREDHVKAKEIAKKKNKNGTWTLPDGKTGQDQPKYVVSNNDEAMVNTVMVNATCLFDTKAIDEDCLFNTRTFQAMRGSECMLIEGDNDGITDPGLTVGEQGHDEIHYVKLSSSVLLAIDNNFRAIMDTGCSRALAGRKWIEAFYSQMSLDDLKQIQKCSSRTTLNSEMVMFTRAWIFPVYFGGLRKRIAFDEVDAAIPLLISLDIVKRLALERRFKYDMARVEDATPWFRLHLENGNHWMSLLKQDSIDDILNDQVNMVMNEVEVDPSPIWLVEDEEVQVILTVNHTKKLLTIGVFDKDKMENQLANLHIPC